MREINGKIGARNEDDSTLEIFIVAHLPLQSSYTGRKGKERKRKERKGKERKGRERKDVCWALPPKRLLSPGRFSCSNISRHNRFDLLKLYGSPEREPSLST